METNFEQEATTAVVQVSNVLQGIEVYDDDSHTNALSVLRVWKQRLKEAEDRRFAMTRPLDESKKLILENYKKATEPYRLGCEEISGKVLAYERRQQDAAQKAASEYARGTITTQQLAESIPTTIPASTRATWGYEIVDASKLPREYLVPNEKLIGEIVRAEKSKTNIPGVVAIERKTLVIK